MPQVVLDSRRQLNNTINEMCSEIENAELIKYDVDLSDISNKNHFNGKGHEKIKELIESLI